MSDTQTIKQLANLGVIYLQERHAKECRRIERLRQRLAASIKAARQTEADISEAGRVIGRMTANPAPAVPSLADTVDYLRNDLANYCRSGRKLHAVKLLVDARRQYCDIALLDAKRLIETEFAAELAQAAQEFVSAN